jgi:hypothetical protein
MKPYITNTKTIDWFWTFNSEAQHFIHLLYYPHLLSSFI